MITGNQSALADKEENAMEKIRYENKIADSLGLSAEEMKYIYGEEQSHIAIAFPVEVDIEVKVDNKTLILDHEAKNSLNKQACMIFDWVMCMGEFNNDSNYSEGYIKQDVVYFKDINNDDEAMAAVTWLVAFKKRFGI